MYKRKEKIDIQYNLRKINFIREITKNADITNGRKLRILGLCKLILKNIENPNYKLLETNCDSLFWSDLDKVLKRKKKMACRYFYNSD